MWGSIYINKQWASQLFRALIFAILEACAGHYFTHTTHAWHRLRLCQPRVCVVVHMHVCAEMRAIARRLRHVGKSSTRNWKVVKLKCCANWCSVATPPRAQEAVRHCSVWPRKASLKGNSGLSASWGHGAQICVRTGNWGRKVDPQILKRPADQ